MMEAGQRKREREILEDVIPLVLKLEDVALSQGMWASFRIWKSLENILP